MVGRSGAALERSDPPTATARSLPFFTCCHAEPMLANITGTWPDMTSIMAGPPPL
ncbi:hypothetical protein D3C86_1038900 [compost metagenome]